MPLQEEKLLVVLDDPAEPTETPGFQEGAKGQCQDSMTEEPVSPGGAELGEEPPTDEETNTSVRF